MVERPFLPLKDLAAIERLRKHIRQDASLRWSFLFGIESLGLSQHIGARGMPPQPMPASLKLELQEYSCALFDAEAQHYARRATDHETLRSSLGIVAELIEAEVMVEISAPVHDFHCAPAERQQTIRDALKDRIQHWLSVQGKQNQKPIVSRAPPPPFTVKSTTAPVQASPRPQRGARLKEYREDAGLTQEALAELIGVSARTVKRHEANETAIRPTNRRAYERELSKSLGHQVTL